MSYLQSADYVSVVLYFIVVIIVGLWSMCRTNRGTVTGYFLAGRFITWLPVGASLFASNIGSEHFIGLAGSGAAGGIGVGAFEFNAILLIQLLGWVFLPVYIASGIHTLPQYIHKRFGGQRIRIYLALLSLVLYIFTKVSVNMYSGALFIQQAIGWDIYVAILLLLGITAICTITGGLAAVIYTDTLQAFLMVIGSLTVMGMGFYQVGGWSGLKEKYPDAMSNYTRHSGSSCGRPREDAFVMLREPIGSDIPWPGFLFGQTPASIWYWCADQVIVQRALASKSLSHAQGGCLFAGYIKILPLFTLVMPGMISRVLYPETVACADPETCMKVCGSPVACTNVAYPKLVLGLMPTGLRGFMLAVMMAALMSDLTSIFNSASSLFTLDIYRRFRSKASVHELMIIGRLWVAVMVVVGILWIPIVQNFQGGQLFIYIQVISAYLSPPIASVYLIAVLWNRCNEKGAFWGLMAGSLVGIIRMILTFVYPDVACGQPDNRPSIVTKVHYMYFAMILFWITGIVCVVVSLLTEPQPRERISRLTFWTRHDETFAVDDEESGELNNIEIELNEAPESKEGQDEDVESKKMFGQESEAGLVEHSDARQKSLLRRGYDWFCGFDETEEGQKSQAEQMRHLRKITSLKQDKFAQVFLNINLILILLVGLYLYVYFSIGYHPARKFDGGSSPVYGNGTTV